MLLLTSPSWMDEAGDPRGTTGIWVELCLNAARQDGSCGEKAKGGKGIGRGSFKTQIPEKVKGTEGQSQARKSTSVKENPHLLSRKEKEGRGVRVAAQIWGEVPTVYSMSSIMMRPSAESGIKGSGQGEEVEKPWIIIYSSGRTQEWDDRDCYCWHSEVLSWLNLHVSFWKLPPAF